MPIFHRLLPLQHDRPRSGNTILRWVELKIPATDIGSKLIKTSEIIFCPRQTERDQ